jgi:pimeloyl-ACP methyl ester carboxylesterase
VVLLGWSLGGLYARELAKRQPDKVAKVITMGSPFSGSPRANNVWRVYQLITGHRVDQPPIEVDLATKPPVETVALWSPNDGMIAPRCAAGLPGERDRAIAAALHPYRLHLRARSGCNPALRTRPRTAHWACMKIFSARQRLFFCERRVRLLQCTY